MLHPVAPIDLGHDGLDFPCQMGFYLFLDGEDGFLLAADGKAASINSATLVYKTWKREGDKLIMDIESIGNGQTIASTDTMNVLKLDKDSLILNNGGMIMRYHRVRE